MREPLLSHERPRSPRLPAVENAILLSWQGHGLALRLKGRMLNVSQTGALILSEVLPPLDQRLRIRLERPIRTDWCDARVVRHGEGHEAGLRFEDCDPYALVLGATMGIDVER